MHIHIIHHIRHKIHVCRYHKNKAAIQSITTIIIINNTQPVAVSQDLFVGLFVDLSIISRPNIKLLLCLIFR